MIVGVTKLLKKIAKSRPENVISDKPGRIYDSRGPHRKKSLPKGKPICHSYMTFMLIIPAPVN
jgi:hypothetical protein